MRPSPSAALNDGPGCCANAKDAPQTVTAYSFHLLRRTAQTTYERPNSPTDRPSAFFRISSCYCGAGVCLPPRDPWHVHDVQHAEFGQLGFEFGDTKSTIKGKAAGTIHC
jgi:hypothetical protein